jgi:hypothetical protein
MYLITLALHNFTRWIVLALGAWALYRAYSGWFGKREWTPTDRKAGMFFSIAMDVQLLIGLVLYAVLSPVTQAAFANFGAAMRDQELRFFAVEHLATMIVALVLVHIGSVVSRKAPTAVAQHRRAAIWFTLAMLAVLFAIPWWRPLLRLG